jgi:hypothetical protein
VKDRKEGDNEARGPHGRPDSQGNADAEREYRQRDADLYRRQRHTEHSQDGPNDHHPGEYYGQDIEQRLPQECAPQSHRDHCEQVVEPTQGMHEASHPPSGKAGTAVCSYWIGNE